MIHVDPHDVVPIYRQIMQQIRLQIVTGQLVPGQQLESVSSLSRRLAINPMTVSKAYGYLVEEALVERRKGVGIFVAQISPRTVDAERRRLLADALGRAAGLAAQMNVSPDDAAAMLREYLNEPGV